MKKIKNQTKTSISTLNRWFDNDAIRAKVNISIFFIAVVFYCGFGIFPLVKTINKKKETITKMEVLLTDMEFKIYEIEKLNASLDQLDNYIIGLNKKVPVTSEMEAFLIEANVISNKSGYQLEKFNKTVGVRQKTIVKLRLSGNPNFIATLIDHYENMSRLVQIDSLTFRLREGVAVVALSLNLFHYEK